MHPLNDGIGNVGIDAHARCYQNGVFGIQPHAQGSKSTQHHRGCQSGTVRDSGVGQDRRVDNDDVHA